MAALRARVLAEVADVRRQVGTSRRTGGSASNQPREAPQPCDARIVDAVGDDFSVPFRQVGDERVVRVDDG